MQPFFILFSPTVQLRPTIYSTFALAQAAAEALSAAHNGIAVYLCETCAVVQESRGSELTPISPSVRP